MVGDAQRRCGRRDAASSQRRVGREHDLGDVVVRPTSPCSRIGIVLFIVPEPDVPAVVVRLGGLRLRQGVSPLVLALTVEGCYDEIGFAVREAATAAGAGESCVGPCTAGGGGPGERCQHRVGRCAGAGVLAGSLHRVELQLETVPIRDVGCVDVFQRYSDALQGIAASVRAGGEGNRLPRSAADVSAARLRTGQAGDRGQGVEPCRGDQLVRVRAGRVAVGRVVVGRVRREAAQILARSADRALASSARVRVLVVPVPAVVGDRQGSCRQADIRDGQAEGIDQRRERKWRTAPRVRCPNSDIVDRGVVDGVVGATGRPRCDGRVDCAARGDVRIFDIRAERIGTAAGAGGALDLVALAVERRNP